MDFPEDKLIWDVGHQAYTHKILTGRKDEFNNLRQEGGLSGFPKRSESDCDAYDAGHSSNSISAGLGYVRARDILGQKHHVVSVIGDGALTGGMAYEALNNAAELNCAYGGNVLVKNANLWYGEFHALKDVSIEIPEKKATAFIGPSGCGKSTFLKCFNRMNDLVEGCRIEGEFKVGEVNIYDKIDVNELRRNVGMVFQKPNPFPMSVYDNVAYGPRTLGVRKRSELDEIVEKSLIGASMWDELKDRLDKSALGLSGGQQQRLCIARALAANPQVLLMDEPTSALDPISTGKIEELIEELKKTITVVIVTHNMQQATRIADKTAFFLLGELVEYGDTEKIFSAPEDKRTENYITGRFG